MFKIYFKVLLWKKTVAYQRKVFLVPLNSALTSWARSLLSPLEGMVALKLCCAMALSTERLVKCWKGGLCLFSHSCQCVITRVFVRTLTHNSISIRHISHTNETNRFSHSWRKSYWFGNLRNACIEGPVVFAAFPPKLVYELIWTEWAVDDLNTENNTCFKILLTWGLPIWQNLIIIIFTFSHKLTFFAWFMTL